MAPAVVVSPSLHGWVTDRAGSTPQMSQRVNQLRSGKEGSEGTSGRARGRTPLRAYGLGLPDASVTGTVFLNLQIRGFSSCYCSWLLTGTEVSLRDTNAAKWADSLCAPVRGWFSGPQRTFTLHILLKSIKSSSPVVCPEASVSALSICCSLTERESNKSLLG